MSVSGLGRIAMADKMSVDQLREALQNRTLPAYIAVPLIEEKLDMNKRMQAMAAMQQAQQQQPPIAEQVMQRAATEGGIESLPTRLASAEGMAGGGIVAFEDGGYVNEPIRFQNLGLVPNVPNATNFVGSLGGGNNVDPKVLRAYYIANNLPIPDHLKTPDELKASAPPADSMLAKANAALQSGNPVLPGADTRIGTMDSKQEVAAKAAQTRNSMAPDMRTQYYKQLTGFDVPTPPAKDEGIAAAAPTVLPEPPTSAGSITDLAREFMMGKDGKGGYLGRSQEREERLMKALGEDRLQGKAFEDYEKQLKKEADEAGLEKDQAKYMALFKAGLAMMAGTSRHALENIGKGAMVGAEDYQKAYSDLKKAERERTKEFALIEQARRAEAKGELERRDNLLMRASDVSDRSDRLGTQALMNAGIKDKEMAQEAWKTNYAGAVQMRGQDITLEAAKARMRPGFTMKDIAKYRSEAMKNVDENAVRAQVASQLKIKAPKPGQDAAFDKRVAQAYEAAIAQYLERVLGGATNSATSLQNKGFSIVPSGSE